MPAAPAKPTAVDRKRLTLESWQVVVGAAGVIITLLVYLHKKGENAETPAAEQPLPLPEAPAVPVAGGTAGGGVTSTYKPGEQVTKAGGEEPTPTGNRTKRGERTAGEAGGAGGNQPVTGSPGTGQPSEGNKPGKREGNKPGSGTPGEHGEGDPSQGNAPPTKPGHKKRGKVEPVVNAGEQTGNPVHHKRPKVAA